LGKNAQNQQLGQKEGIVLIIAMLQSLILLNGGWISQMNARIPGIHYTVYQPVPIVRGLYHQALELTSKRFQGLQNEIEVIGDTLLEYAFELLVQNPNVGVA
jgi:hypothetical protein